MSAVVIRVENLSKRYRIGEKLRYPTLGDVLSNQAAKVRRPFMSINRNHHNHHDRQERVVSPKDVSDIWALRDVSFDVRQGDILGIVGRNGAGKSTLLKILSRITKPTSGGVKMRGRVGSLLEVGTGFHPELTGRENIYLNGAVLGMKKTEIDAKFDEIVDFAEVEQFIDTPVKRFSSGMYMRLAFAVAAHLESEILIVDEVLAVGDAAFQKKCLGKMGDIAHQGRTILFVSHNMDAIQRLCNTCFLLEKGQLVLHGSCQEVISQYLSNNPLNLGPNAWINLSTCERSGNQKAFFNAVHYSSGQPALGNFAYPLGPLQFTLQIQSDSARSVNSLAVKIYTQSGTKLINADIFSLGETVELQPGENFVQLQIEQLYLNPGIYGVGFWLGNTMGETFDKMDSAFDLEVITGETLGLGETSTSNGMIPCQFRINQLVEADNRAIHWRDL